MKHVLLAGGGTAGHVEPALNLAELLASRAPAPRLTFLGTSRGLETALVPSRGHDLVLIDATPLPRRPGRALLMVPRDVRRSVRQVRALIEREQVDVVVGFGGYVALPAYLAARKRAGIVVHEANAKAGLANRVGARLTPFVAQAVDGTLPHAKTIGIPLRPSITTMDRTANRQTARASLGLDPARPCLLVFGGSQGARRMNAAVVAAVGDLVARGFQVMHVYGPQNADQAESLLASGQAHYVAVDYLDRMQDAYAAADLALCRSGALTCAELAAVGLPAIYCPFPIGNGEQRLNAAPIVAVGGGAILDDSDLSPGRILDEVAPILCDPDRIASMSSAAARLGVRDGGARLADMVDTCVAGRSRPHWELGSERRSGGEG